MQEAFERIVTDWASFSPTPELPERSARRRWIAGHLLNAGRRVRDRGRRIQKRELPAGSTGHASVVTTSPEARVSARETLRSLQRTTSPDRWRAWIAHEVDGVSVAEIARQEGRPRATVYNLLRLARQDFTAAIARDAVADRAPAPAAEGAARNRRGPLPVLAAGLLRGLRRGNHGVMVFADLKNDYIFRRIFGTHPDILRGLLNDLLERTGDQTIEQIEYLPSEQLPLVVGAKLSILDVRCKDRSGNRFVVEMQLIHVPGFLNRVVYNGCKAYAGQLGAGKPGAALTDVVAISICDFELWPDAEQDRHDLSRVPMLSRWFVTERSLDREDLKRDPARLLQVQYAFLELPKLPEEKPAAGAALWAWLFVHAPELTDIPADLPSGPFREALDLANQGKFTPTELDAYQKAVDEIEQAREYGAAKFAEGETAGFTRGETAGVTRALTAILGVRGFTVSTEARAHIDACKDTATLERWILRATSAASLADVFAEDTDERT